MMVCPLHVDVQAHVQIHRNYYTGKKPQIIKNCFSKKGSLYFLQMADLRGAEDTAAMTSVV